MKQFFITVIGTIIGLFIFVFLFFFLIIGMITASASSAEKANDPGNAYLLSLDLRAPLQDHSSGDSLFGPSPANIVDTIRALNQAKNDNEVKGLFIRANHFGMVPASAEELRLAIADFRQSGKFVITHSQGFDNTTLSNYMAIAGSDEIWLQASAGFAPTGYRSEVDFYGGTLEKFGVKAEFEQFHEYKNAPNSYLQTGLTDSHREATTSLLTSLYDTSIAHIAQDRDLETSALINILNTSPLSAETALEAKLIDKLGHYQTALDYARTKAGDPEMKLRTVTSYGVLGYNTGPVIAFIGGQGAVTLGRSLSGISPFSPAVTMGGDTLASAIRMAAKDESVKAIVFRVSTTGGSPVAADQIHNAITYAQEAGKPVIVSMGQYAASAGYYVAAPADHIVAMPTTITGSIGVFGGKIALRDAYAKLDYNVDHIAIGGEYLNAFSTDEPFTDYQREVYRATLQNIYDDFTNVVAQGRNLPMSKVQDIAKGRVWPGQEALEIGLVDSHGGILSAIDKAKELANIEPDTKIYLKTFPRPKTTQQQLQEILSVSAAIGSDLETLRAVQNLPEVQALIDARNALNLSGQELKAHIPDIK